MSLVLLTLLLLVNLLISAWNAYAVGRTWDDSRSAPFGRVVGWAGLVMSASGFTYVYVALFGWGAYMANKLTVESLQALLSLGYLAIIIPVIGSGAVITLHSWHIAWKQRTLGNMAVAGYNTFAQAHNMLSAIRDIPGAFDIVMSFFGSDTKGKSKSKDEDKATVLLIAIFAIAAGVLSTYSIFATGRRHALLSADRVRRAARVDHHAPNARDTMGRRV